MKTMTLYVCNQCKGVGDKRAVASCEKSDKKLGVRLKDGDIYCKGSDGFLTLRFVGWLREKKLKRVIANAKRRKR
jgi:hypothetical protein